MKRERREKNPNLSRREFVKTAAAGLGAATLGGVASTEAEAEGRGLKWDREADVVVVGAGAAGLPAAIEAAEGGASVILIDANFDIGGHAMVSGGNVALGGGTTRQRKYGIEDSADLLFADLTDWSVVEPNGFPDYRYNDKEIIRAFADQSAPTFEWLVAHGVIFVEKAPDNLGAGATGNSAPRENHCAPMQWVRMQTGKQVDASQAMTMSSGVGLVRPLEVAARKAKVEILLKHKMSSLVRQEPTSGRVLGLKATNEGKSVNIRARKAVVLATGGSSNNVNFRRMFDVRLTEEYNGVAGEPYSFQDGSGELAGLAIGASLWGAYNQVGEYGDRLTKAGRIGTRYGYRNLQWEPGSPLFHLVRAVGLNVRDYQNVILVNQAGMRFYDETAGQYTANNYHAVASYKPGSYLNAKNINYNPANFLDAALAGTGEAVNGGGPIWAIFDADAVMREKWTVAPPYVDPDGYFYSADTLHALAAAIDNKYQRKPISGAVLESTVARYNSFVESGKDEDFGKPAPKYKIQTPPFYAAWAMPVIHDTRAGLRINAKCQVVDFSGTVIAGLYCAGESAGGFGLHGLARCLVQGRIAGMNAAAEAVTRT
ncbi:MAG TPA: FAD-dependent oxidoreductase [Candidatus Acidoferrales bacterium]|jgi:succinate dehydrogenase/fumarate reductase flavoprotein subunit|nr:FAD-dependent oxidoreductase [Candidatus Acidoferrales bacterium]